MDTVRLVEFNAAYARAIDDEEFEQWPEMFTELCLYKVTTASNIARGLESGIIYADSRAMLRDRVSALRKANIYERQRYRHIIGLPQATVHAGDSADVETPFLIVRIMRDGAMDLFASGVYRDKVVTDENARLRLAERIVVCDGGRFDTLVAIPL